MLNRDLSKEIQKGPFKEIGHLIKLNTVGPQTERPQA